MLQILPWGELLYFDQHIFKESKMKRKFSYGMDWLQKGIRYGSAKIDYTHFQTVQGTIYQPLRSGRIWHKVDF